MAGLSITITDLGRAALPVQSINTRTRFDNNGYLLQRLVNNHTVAYHAKVFISSTSLSLADPNPLIYREFYVEGAESP